MTDHKKAIPWVLAAIAKVKGQKQQPNEERICQVLLQSYAMEKTEGLEHLQKCVEEELLHVHWQKMEKIHIEMQNLEPQNVSILFC